MDITVEEYEKLKDSFTTVDVRTISEVNSLKRLPWAIHIEMNELLNNLEKHFPNKSEKLVIVCNAGNRAGEVTRQLRSAGYENAYNLIGGTYGYFREKF